MKSEHLHVILPLNNQVGWESRFRLTKEAIEAHLDEGCKVTLVECAYGDHKYQFADLPNITHVPCFAKSHIWIKENLINLGIASLPRDAKFIAWFDADVFYRDAGWARETLHALQYFPIVQPWATCYDLGPNDEHMETHKSFGRQYAEGHKIGFGKNNPYQFAHPGYAWAATRDMLDGVGGLIEHAIAGAGDHHMALALIGKGEKSLPGKIHPNYAAKIMEWQALADRAVNKKIGYVPRTIEHKFHGAKGNRKYIDRWDMLTEFAYDPNVDVRYNTSGVLELTDTKPEFAMAMWRYFRQRNEDANSI
jgi:hypothetical protein